MSEEMATDQGKTAEERGPPRDHGHEHVYTESPIIMTTVRTTSLFALVYGLFLVFHGADTPGGSFQGGAIIGATVLMIAFAFGIEPTREWIANQTVVALVGGGAFVFTAVGLIPMAFGGRFLEHPLFEAQFGINTKWGLEAIEVGGVAPIVAGAVIGLFYVIAAGLAGQEADGLTGGDQE